MTHCLFCYEVLVNMVFLSTGQVIKHGDIKCVQSEGMPLYRDPYEKGQLIIHFEVKKKKNPLSNNSQFNYLEPTHQFQPVVI